MLADAGGRFGFKGMPLGYYYVGAQVIWDAATGYQGAKPQGAMLRKELPLKVVKQPK